MEYKCETISLQKMLIGPKGSLEPLCNICKAKDCTNPVQWQNISIMGVKKKFKILTVGDYYYAVIKCEGFLP